MQFALRYPERTSSLVLIVPGTYTPEKPVESPSPVPLPFIFSMIFKSDFPLWVAMKHIHRVFSILWVFPIVPVQTHGHTEG